MLSGPTVASDEVDVVAESAGGTSFPTCALFGEPVPPNIPLVAIEFTGPDFATMTWEVRLVCTVSELTAIAPDVPNPTAPSCVCFLDFCVLLALSC